MGDVLMRRLSRGVAYRQTERPSYLCAIVLWPIELADRRHTSRSHHRPGPHRIAPRLLHTTHHHTHPQNATPTTNGSSSGRHAAPPKQQCCSGHHAHNNHQHAAGGPPRPAAAALPPVPDAMKTALGMPTLSELQQMSPAELKELKGALQQRLARQLQQHGHVHGNGAVQGPMGPMVAAAAAAAAGAVVVGTNGSGNGNLTPAAAAGGGNGRAALPAAAVPAASSGAGGVDNGGQPPSAEPPSAPIGGPEGNGAGGMDIFEAGGWLFF